MHAFLPHRKSLEIQIKFGREGGAKIVIDHNIIRKWDCIFCVKSLSKDLLMDRHFLQVAIRSTFYSTWWQVSHRPQQEVKKQNKRRRDKQKLQDKCCASYYNHITCWLDWWSVCTHDLLYVSGRPHIIMYAIWRAFYV